MGLPPAGLDQLPGHNMRRSRTLMIASVGLRSTRPERGSPETPGVPQARSAAQLHARFLAQNPAGDPLADAELAADLTQGFALPDIRTLYRRRVSGARHRPFRAYRAAGCPDRAGDDAPL